MRIVFNGTVEQRRSGCSACRKAHTKTQFLALKTYILPSGVIKTFRAGVPVTVSEQDAHFLLSLRYTTPAGPTRHAFEVVP